ncbi:cytochrome P450 [Lichtheimia hyalospora FSU 10163]|nr:cytochrome P450 [Lichtheimia hyalospora FSU 10163]
MPAYTFKQWHLDHGPVLRVNLGAQEWVMVSDTDILQELLVHNGAASSSRPFVNYSSGHYALNKKGIVLSDANKKWKSLRSAALTILSPKMVNEYSHVHLSEADMLVDELIKTSGESQGIDPEKLLKKTSLNYVLDTCFGMRVPSEKDPWFKAINTFIDEGLVLGGPHNDLGAIFPALSFVDKLLGRDNMFATFIKEKRDPLFLPMIQQAASGERDCLIKRLVDNKEEYGLDDDDILVAACDLITGGTDTTAITLSWIIAILLNHPDACKRLAREVDVFISEHKRYPVFSDRSQFSFLNAVQKECMRYRSIGHFVFFHVLDKDIQTHGYLFPKGSWIYPSTYTIHTNSDIYPDADKFVPERFLEDTKTMAAAANSKPGERDHYTFGFGRRVCPGIHLAMEMFNVLVRIFARCTIEPALDAQGKPILPDLDAPRDGGITVLPPHYRVRFIPRPDALI